MTACDLYFGRFQPYHNGHREALKAALNQAVIAVVRGKDIGKKSPFPLEYTKELVTIAEPNATIIDVPNGYIPDIVTKLQDEHGLHVMNIICGPDRVDEYKAQLDRSKLEDTINRCIKLLPAKRVTSATEVRETLRSGDQMAFEAKVPKELWDQFTTLTRYIGNDYT